MGGSVDFKTALQTRLGVMKPNKQDIQRFLRDHPHKVTPGKGVCGQGPWWERAAGGSYGTKWQNQFLTQIIHITGFLLSSFKQAPSHWWHLGCGGQQALAT